MKRKPWYRSKKVWGVIMATALGLTAPGLGATATQTLAAIVTLMTGVGIEGVIDAASALRGSARTLRDEGRDALREE